MVDSSQPGASPPVTHTRHGTECADGQAAHAAPFDHGKQIWLIRHAETEWSKSGKHTGVSDIPLTTAGEDAARGLRAMVSRPSFQLVLSSPRQRAIQTCILAGVSTHPEIDPDLSEWDYGEYEGVTTKEIVSSRPGWDLWRDGCPQGETLAQVAQRCQRVIDRCLAVPGHCAVFAHGHVSRVMAAVFLQHGATLGANLALRAGSVSVLGFEHSNRVLWHWDVVPDLGGSDHAR
ncbi:MAG: histidine phosphatase family protein [Planctomycetota bacterium]|nr:histidine phosphatase family protein [Planctomycetota bacterium]MDA1105883.1 histidine phosphatase family protein [Planctomycetota bacterium]